MNDPYCGVGGPPLSPAWVNSGYSPCFLSTMTSLLSLSWILLTGAAAVFLPDKKKKNQPGGGLPGRLSSDTAAATAARVRQLRLMLTGVVCLSYLVHIALVAVDIGAVEYETAPASIAPPSPPRLLAHAWLYIVLLSAK